MCPVLSHHSLGEKEYVMSTQYKHPNLYASPYKSLPSIPEQVKTLLEISEFKNINADWIMRNGEAWYNNATSKLCMRNLLHPCVYIRPDFFEDYQSALIVGLSAISDKYMFEVQYSNINLCRNDKICMMEEWFLAEQSGDFIVVPSFQHDYLWGITKKEIRGNEEASYMFLGAFAEICRLLTHSSLITPQALRPVCMGDFYRKDTSKSPTLIWDNSGFCIQYKKRSIFSGISVGINLGACS